MTYTGRCLCGKVTLAISGEPLTTRQCWCRQCQQIACGGPTHNAIFKTADVTVTGDLAASAWDAASGNVLTASFCPACGTHIHGQPSARPHLLVVRLGVLDEPHGLKPEVVIWTDDAPDWALIDPALEQWPQQAPPAPPPPDSVKA
ncbi:MAG: GFA family protein [Pseudomonadota bacterium]